jgi:uncharacterized membrane protein
LNMEGLVSAGAVLILWAMGLAQGLLEYKTAKAKKQSRINTWWATGVPLIVLGIGLLFVWGFFARNNPFAEAFLTMAIGATFTGVTLTANAKIEKEHFQAKRLILREKVKNVVLASGVVCITVYFIYALIKIFTDWWWSHWLQ